jgi:hypothetical protein
MSQIEFECRMTWFQAAIAWWDVQTRALIELHHTLYICAVLPVSSAAITIRRWTAGECCSKSHQSVL